ncbi:MAG: YuzB family protein [Alicyclobacillus sp.]|nr:YuzB family protein [Alicyclobacillus sp.]
MQRDTLDDMGGDSMSLVLVEVCDANPADVPELYELEQTHRGVSVVEMSCMSQCELCARQPYVLVNGEVVQASDTGSLIRLVRERVEALLAEWEGHTADT